MIRLFDRRIILFAGFFILFTVSARAEDSHWPDARRLLIESVGGDSAVAKLKTIRAIETFGTSNTNGYKCRFHAVVAPPEHHFLDIQHEGYSLGHIINGNCGWEKSLNGQFVPMGSVELNSAKRKIFAENMGFLCTDSINPAPQIDSIVQLSDRTCWLVRVPIDWNHEIEFFIDTLTDLRVATRWNQDYTSVQRVHTNFDTTEGLILPITTTETLLGSDFVVTETIDSIRVRTEIDSSLFQPPSFEPLVSYPAGRDSIVIPIKHKNGLILVEATLNGKRKLKFLLDSGASISLFYFSALKGLSTPHVGRALTRRLAGIDDVALVRIDTIAFGYLELIGTIVGAIDSSYISRSDVNSNSVDGILGYETFAQFPMTINLSKKRLVFHNPKTFQPHAGATVIPFEFYSRVPTIQASVCSVAGPFFVDLGNSFGTCVHLSFFRRNDLDSCLANTNIFFDALLNGPEKRALHDQISSMTSIVSELTVGPFTRYNIPIMSPALTEVMSGSREIAGSLGTPFFESYELTLDYPNRVLYLLPTKL